MASQGKNINPSTISSCPSVAILQATKSSYSTKIVEATDTGYVDMLLHKFDQARKEGSFCDVKFLVGPEKYLIQGHRMVLSTFSEYFKTICNTHLKEGSQSEIVLPETNPDVMEAIIGFAYTGKMKIHGANVEQLLFGADFFWCTRNYNQ